MTALPSKIPRTCSQCGLNGHNARTCTESSAMSAIPSPGIMLFGVRLTATGGPVSPSSQISPSSSLSSSSIFRKSMSMNNLSQYEQQKRDQQLLSSALDSSNGNGNDDVVRSGYASDDALHASGSRSRDRDRKRGVPWTEEEHKLFLMGLDKVGKGDWRAISRNFVKSRTPTQVASHAQKYYLRRTSTSRRRRRSSLFDITTETISKSASGNQLTSLDSTPTIHETKPFSPPYPPSSTLSRSMPTLPAPPFAKMASLNLNESPATSSPSSSTSSHSTREKEYEPFLSLKLSQAPSDEESSRRSPTFRGFNGRGGDNIISVA